MPGVSKPKPKSKTSGKTAAVGAKRSPLTASSEKPAPVSVPAKRKNVSREDEDEENEGDEEEGRARATPAANGRSEGSSRGCLRLEGTRAEGVLCGRANVPGTWMFCCASLLGAAG